MEGWGTWAFSTAAFLVGLMRKASRKKGEGFKGFGGREDYVPLIISNDAFTTARRYGNGS